MLIYLPLFTLFVERIEAARCDCSHQVRVVHAASNKFFTRDLSIVVDVQLGENAAASSCGCIFTATVEALQSCHHFNHLVELNCTTAVLVIHLENIGPLS